MSMSYDQKEDLRLRMADLEKKLAESEDERCKLEKTCNVLMRAFREEERMQYKALNKKYEKFLEDCSVRKRRNDIILRSLCRIEDRSRALFAKTERLKLLKDRYISYLKRSDITKEETKSVSFLPERSKDSPKSLQWRTPLATHWETERFRQTGDLSLGSITPRTTTSDLLARFTEGNFQRQTPEEKPTHEGRKTNVLGGSSSSRDEPSPIKSWFDQTHPLPESEKLTLNQTKPEYRVYKKEETREEKGTGHHESVEKVKEPDEDIWEKSKEHDREIEDGRTTTQNSPLFPRINYRSATSTPNKSEENTSWEGRDPDDREADDQSGKSATTTQNKINLPVTSKSEEEKPLPMGLDGVDYQNETYPESYYEQPVHHHNHTSIASDVILEEDETEQELDEEVKDLTPDEATDGHEPTPWAHFPGHGTLDEPRREGETNKEADKGRDVNDDKSQQSEKSSKQSDRSEKVVTDRSEKNKMAKSNLFHLLESDSESFQIEHGDAVSGNEDSDFDFSFHQN